MSESAPTPVAAPETAPVAPAVPVAAPVSVPAPAVIDPMAAPAVVKEQARHAMNDRLAARRAEAAAARAANPVGTSEPPSVPSPADTPTPVLMDALGRGHAADGTYTPGTTPPVTSESPEAQTPAVAQAPQPGTPADGQVAQAPPATVRIQLPEGHPLRSEGLEYLDASPTQERAIRALLNNPVRQREVAEWQTKAQTAEQQVAALTAGYAALQEQVFAFLGHPEIAERAAEIEQAWGPEEKARYLSGVFAEIDKQIQGKVETARSEVAQQHAAARAEELGQSFYEHVAPGAEAWFRAEGWPVDAQFGGHLRQAMDRAADDWHAAGEPDWDESRMVATVHRRLIDALTQVPAYWQGKQRYDETARQAAETARQREADAKARAATAEANAQSLQAAARARTTLNPIAQAPPVVGGSGPAAIEPEPDYTQMSPSEIQRQARERSRQRLATR